MRLLCQEVLAAGDGPGTVDHRDHLLPRSQRVTGGGLGVRRVPPDDFARVWALIRWSRRHHDAAFGVRASRETEVALATFGQARDANPRCPHYLAARSRMRTPRQRWFEPLASPDPDT